MASEPLGNVSPPQYSLRSLFVVTTIFALLLGILVPWVQASRESSRQTQCKQRLLELGFGLQNHQSTFNDSLPAAFTADAKGRPLHSWRTRLLPYLTQLPQDDSTWSWIYAKRAWDEPWDAPTYNVLRSISDSGFYNCPVDKDGATEHATSYLAVVGPATPWPGKTPGTLPQSAKARSKTILLVEAVGSGVHWMEPRDLKLDDVDGSFNGSRPPCIRSEHAKGVNILFADASVQLLPRDTPPSDIVSMLTIGTEDVSQSAAKESEER